MAIQPVLFFVYVQTGTANSAVLQGLDQRGLIHYRPARNIHQNRAGLHQAQFAVANQVFGFFA